MRYPSIEQVARKVRKEPDLDFVKLTRIGQRARIRGYFTKTEFLQICRWKSRRRIDLCLSNSDQAIRAFTAFAFSANDERTRIQALLKLAGVGVPTASALLAVFNPSSFGVIDIRAWQFLYSTGAVSTNQLGINLSVRNWLQYVNVIREVASQIKSTPRLVEISLYMAHKNAQQEPLYRSGKVSSRSVKCACRSC